LGQSWDRHGSLGAHFLKGLSPEDSDISGALDELMREWAEWAGPRAMKGSFSYLLTAPQNGSACKRWCMFLRWMGRSDPESDEAIDLGLWGAESRLVATFPRGRFLRADQLVIPLDTHTGRISQYLGLTQRKSLNWRAALEVTEALRECSPSDPVRYDFALARLGILDLCQKKYRIEICEKCSLLPVCRFGMEKR
jgi:uncharacterized protein (TIGR02757 family)